jgi:hypothetical protein
MREVVREESAYRCLIHDRDSIVATRFDNSVRALGRLQRPASDHHETQRTFTDRRFLRTTIIRAGLSASDFTAFVRTEIAKWTNVARATGMQLD